MSSASTGTKWSSGSLGTSRRSRTIRCRAPSLLDGCARSCPASPPAAPEPFEEVLADLDRVVLPGVTHWQHPGWHAYFPTGASGPSVLADLVSSGLGVQGMLWSTSPACTELETLVLDWMAELLGLPERFRSDGDGGGVIEESASGATLCALLAARWRTAGDGPFDHLARLHVDPGAQLDREGDAHRRAAARTSCGRSRSTTPSRCGRTLSPPRWPTTAPPASRRSSSSPTSAPPRRPPSIRSGPSPTPVRGTGLAARRCRPCGVGAGVPRAALDRRRLERADSFCMNPHKWLFTNFDCDCFWVADRSALIGALTVLPEYLRNAASESGAVVDYRDWQVPLGRRFRCLKLWFVLRSYGAEGLQHHIREHIELAQRLAARLARASAARGGRTAPAEPRLLPPRRRRRRDGGAAGRASTPRAACCSPTRGSMIAT